MMSLRVICGLGPPNQKSWLRLWEVLPHSSEKKFSKIVEKLRYYFKNCVIILKIALLDE